ncbi:hypothetical protein FD723_10335 [Nostoc sp. C052]|nr:hypothetical protein FD723_10335 [Nostoc sp. C052]
MLVRVKKGGTGIKIPVLNGDLGGSKIFDTDKRTFQTSSKEIYSASGLSAIMNRHCAKRSHARRALFALGVPAG